MIYLAFYTEKDRPYNRRKEHELGRALLAHGLELEYGIGKEDVRILRQEGGKPYLDGFSELHFNISHCDGAVVCVIHEAPVGVDIERIRPYTKSLAGRVLTEEEAQELARCQEKDREACFFRYWTLKESYGKAIGEGLAKPMREISFRWDSEGNVSGSDPGFLYAACTVRKTYQIAVSIKLREGEKDDISGSI